MCSFLLYVRGLINDSRHVLHGQSEAVGTKTDQLTICMGTLCDWLPGAERNDGLLRPERLLVDESSPSRTESWKRQTVIKRKQPSGRKVKHFRLYLHEGERPVNVRNQILKVLLPQEGVFGQCRGQVENHRCSHLKRLSGNADWVNYERVVTGAILSIRTRLACCCLLAACFCCERV